MTSLSVSVVIVTWNGWPLLLDCLESLRGQTRTAEQIIVLDNGSTDGTQAKVREQFPEVFLIEAGENLGFAKGNNLGLKHATGDVVVLLNNDTDADPRFLEELVAPLERSREIGAVASTMVFATAPNLVASAGIEVYRNGLALDRAIGHDLASIGEEQAVFGASAGAAAYRRALLDELGGFADSFFMYLEDVDLAWRIRLLGWEVVHAPGAIVRHAYSASSVEGSDQKRWLLARNRVWMLARCAPSWYLWRNWWRIAWYDIVSLTYSVMRRDGAAFRGRLAGYRGLGTVLRERQVIQSGIRVTPDVLNQLIQPAPGVRDLLRLRRLTAQLAVTNCTQRESSA